MSKVIRIVHPIAQAALTVLRDVNTNTAEFVRASDVVASFLAAKVTEETAHDLRAVQTPLAESLAVYVCEKVVLVPILRAGLALQEPFRRFFPTAAVHHVGIRRDESTALPQRYYPAESRKIESTLTILADPMLASGGSAVDAIGQCVAAGAQRIVLASVIAAPEGIEYVHARYPDVKIYTLAVDSHLNENKYIVPGLGDYGDRYFGT